MKPNDKSKTSTKIKLTKTFFKIEKGETTPTEVQAQKRAAREAAKQEIIRKGGIPDRTDPFIGNFNK